ERPLLFGPISASILPSWRILELRPLARIGPESTAQDNLRITQLKLMLFLCSSTHVTVFAILGRGMWEATKYLADGSFNLRVRETATHDV
ncbi:hypothetical protein CTAM01_12016, partial [Colletotrichum tamarilloi]